MMRGSVITVVVVLGATNVALAEPRKTDPAAEAKCLQQLRLGRQLQAKKKYQEAIAAFQVCLDVVEDDAVTLVEAGWTAYLANDLVHAEKWTRAGVASQGTAAVRGAALYNLGLIQVARGDTAGAIASYIESIKTRPNGVVRAALAKLDAAAADALDPFRPRPMAGPFKTIEAYCKGLPPKTDPRVDDLVEPCSCTDPMAVKHGAPAAPYDRVVVFTSKCAATPKNMDDERGWIAPQLGVQFGGAWYVSELEQTYVGRNCYAEDQHVAFLAIDVKDVIPGGKPGALAKVERTGKCWNGNAVWDYESTTVVGIGPSGKPAATEISTKRYETTGPDEGEPTQTVDANVVLTIKWNADGTIQLDGTGLDKNEASNRLGKHAMVFP